MRVFGNLNAVSGIFDNGLTINDNEVIPTKAIPSGYVGDISANSEHGDEFYHLASGYMINEQGNKWTTIGNSKLRYSYNYEDNGFPGITYNNPTAETYEIFNFTAASGGSYACNSAPMSTSGLTVMGPQRFNDFTIKYRASICAAGSSSATHAIALFVNENIVDGSIRYFSGDNIIETTIDSFLSVTRGDFVSLRYTSDGNNKNMTVHSATVRARMIEMRL